MGNMGAWLRVIPRKAVNLVRYRERQKLMIGGVKLDLVDAHAVSIERLELGCVPVRQIRLVESRFPANCLAKRRQVRRGPPRTFAFNRVAQNRIFTPQVLVPEVGRHVEHVVSRQLRSRREWMHQETL